MNDDITIQDNPVAGKPLSMAELRLLASQVGARLDDSFWPACLWIETTSSPLQRKRFHSIADSTNALLRLKNGGKL